MKKLATAIFLLPTLFVSTRPHAALAGPNERAQICLHAETVVAKNACGRSLPAIWYVRTRANLLPATYFVYLLVVNGSAAEGVAGLQCGIQYDGAPGSGVDVYSWTLCATLEFPSTGWPASGGGNLITWQAAACQQDEPGGPGTGVTAAAGYFYCAAYTPDRLTITPRPVDGEAKVADCSAREDILGTLYRPLGYVDFSATGSAAGLCLQGDPVEPTTWSGIKALHGRM